MYNYLKLQCLSVFLLLTISCGGSISKPTQRPATTSPKDICVVLSVGSEKGIAHIGVLTALHEKGISVDCVVGNSMGALVGGLYAANPQKDPAKIYQNLLRKYETQTRSDINLFQFFTGSFNKLDWRRFQNVLRKNLDGQRIESLNVIFVTEHQVTNDSKIRRELIRGGILADEIASSMANPILFKDIKIKHGVTLDPGADRVSAIPLEAACKIFPDKQFIVSNVTGEKAFTSSKMKCSVQELMLPTVEVDAELALSGKDPSFRALIASGYNAAIKSIKWKDLPQEKDIANPPLEFVKATITTKVTATKESGDSWDGIMNKAPDPYISTSIVACESCDTYGTSVGSNFEKTFKNKFEFQQKLGVLALRKGFTIKSVIIDKDLSQDDAITTATFVFEKVGTQVKVSTSQADLVITFEQL